MDIKEEGKNSIPCCEVCAQGKFVQTRNRGPDRSAKAPLDMVHIDLAGTIDLMSHSGHRYALSLRDDYSSAVLVYFLRNKSDTVQGTERFIADVAPYGKIKCMRYDNGTEYTGRDFQALMNRSIIRHETLAPYSPHQNGIAEQRTLFEMALCMLIESELPKTLRTYAVQTAAVVRNRCFNNHTKQTPFYMLTGRQPNAYKRPKGKLESRC